MSNGTWNDDKDLYPEGDVRNNMISKTYYSHVSNILRTFSFIEPDNNLKIVRIYSDEEEDIQKKFFIDHLSQDISREHAELVVNDIWKSAKNILSKRDIRDINSKFIKMKIDRVGKLYSKK